jgi:hemolysin III
MSESVRAPYTFGEELANSLTHAVGLVLSIAGLSALLGAAAMHGGWLEIASCAIYGTTLIVLYLTSTLYHSIPFPLPKRILRTMDHLAIFLLIAGTYTPFMLIALRGTWGRALFALVWILALVGAVMDLSPLRRHRRVMIGLYVLLGWIGIVAIKPLIAALPAAALWLLFGGGVSYTLGVVFYRWHGQRYHHALWHLCVLGGSVLHYCAVLYYVLPERGAGSPP